MKQAFLTGRGKIEVAEVPVPARLVDSVLVRNVCSLISTGTESAAVTSRSGVLGLYEKVVSSTERVNQVWDLARRHGLAYTWDLVHRKLQQFTAIGYSSAGYIVEVDHGGVPFAVGDRVACMGTGFASHAEYVVVPKNLVARVPEGVSFESASFGALGCVALQGIRRLELTPGERIGVIGLGLVGQLCVRLLDAMGYQVFGMDLRPARAAQAAEVNGVTAWALVEVDSVRRVDQLTAGQGLDGVIVCAASASDDPINLAFDVCRPQGRVSVVGDVGLRLERSKMFAKELELRMSRSYGPGRYDPGYELDGHDYPVDYVRWTEGRNLEYFLRLLASRRFDIDRLVSARFPVDDAPSAYALVKKGEDGTRGVIFDFAPSPTQDRHPGVEARTLRAAVPSARPSSRRIRLGLIGIGGYAKGVHIPNLKRMSDTFEIVAVSSRSAAGMAEGARLTGARVVTSEYHELLAERDVDAVLVATRHASHGRIALDALKAGKHLFVEKPLATDVDTARSINQLATASGLVVRVGFNRRFAPMIAALRSVLGVEGVRMLACRVDIGRIEDDWSNTAEEGGRFLGEGVHFFDLFNWLLGAEPATILATSGGPADVTNPNMTVLVRYHDGSTAQLVYTALGNASLGKECYEAFGNGRSARIEDLGGSGGKTVLRRLFRRADTSRRAILAEFGAAIRGESLPVVGADARAGLVATWTALAAYRSASERQTIAFDV